jgi:dolichyl-phosphate-mannose--protein O-mannosyl transferase
LYSRFVGALLPPPPPAAGAAAPAARQLSEFERNVWCLVLGFTCANAFSVKMTGAVTPFLVAVESFFGLWFLKRGAPFLDLLKVLVTGALTYAGWFAVHFAILTRHGDGDEEFTTERFQSTLLESRHYDPAARWEGFWTTFYALNRRMIVHNANILAPHPWMSSWNEWVLNIRGVAYYGKDGKDTYTAAVYLIGNHAIHMGVIAALVLFVACVALHLRVRPFAARLQLLGHSAAAATPGLAAFFASGSFCVVAYCLNLIPYLGVARSTFIYHYMPALIYGELLLARVVEHLAGSRTPQAARLVLLIVGLVWLHYTPWIYGFPLTNDAHQRRRWNPRWD